MAFRYKHIIQILYSHLKGPPKIPQNLLTLGICYEGLPEGYSNGTIDGLNLVIIQVLYSGQRAGNLGRPEVNGWKFDKNFDNK